MGFKRNILILSFAVLSAGLYFAAGTVVADEINEEALKNRKVQLEKDLEGLEVQISGYRTLIQSKQEESASLQRDIDVYNAKISKAKLEIQRLDLTIANASAGILSRSSQIGSLEEKANREKESLAELIRKSDEVDDMTIVEMVLGNEELSDFFVITDSFASVQKSIHLSLEEIRNTNDKLGKEIDQLEEEKAEKNRLKTAQEMNRKSLAASEAEKKELLNVTKGLEKNYQTMLTSKQKDAAKIRSQLFLLTGSPDISFEKAVEYANIVWKETGVRQAFLLGVIREESNLGANVGTGNWKVDLSHSRCEKQRTAFMEITSELGLDPDLMPVSKKAWYGYCGGAMGPAQFMPTTWNLYKAGIAKRTGHNPPNPWDPLDAFMASGLLLRDNGAAKGGYEAERRAALRYLAGGNWNTPSYAFYGDDVMGFAQEYQEQIDIISGN